MINANPVDELLNKRVGWLADSGPDDDIAISSRIRLARNLTSYTFPTKADQKELKAVISSIREALENTDAFREYFFVEIDPLPDLDRQIFLERRIVSRDFIVNRKSSALVLSRDEADSIMINEEDHIRMQRMLSGLRLKNIWDEISKTDDIITEKLPIAYDDELGFLTSCPTNIGTGIRASVMLHLPGLMLAGQINQVIQAVHKMGLAVRGIFGEGTENLGNLYQISNQSTLGEPEIQIIEKLDTVIRQIIFHEKNSRQKLIDTRKNFVMDHVGRAYGILRHAYMISSQDTLNSLSALRLGVDMGMFSALDIHTVNELFVLVQPGHLQKYAGRQIKQSAERDELRASLIRERLKSKKNKSDQKD
jgi:protein arginine kinase